MGLRGALIALALAASCASQAAEAQARVVQQRIKAAFLYKFAAYVEWPPHAFAKVQGPIVIGVSGDDLVAEELEQFAAGRQVAGRPIEVRRLEGGVPAASCCQILFVGNGSTRAPELLASARGHPVLTVTEADNEQPSGSIINFLVGGDRVRFDISRGAADRNGLQLRSPLLAVARKVKIE